ncbi:hypothetical protein NPIL_511481 [Nephila pilipes]|uniref:Uncharacterized protein n=1 Tax=Nephila pilipes TaxID=299642 RepID=A0A8X6MZW1_NEPPI|nr:hypothetical protein NPIL_511481 [Nephila pilipes]
MMQYYSNWIAVKLGQIRLLYIRDYQIIASLKLAGTIFVCKVWGFNLKFMGASNMLRKTYEFDVKENLNCLLYSICEKYQASTISQGNISVLFLYEIPIRCNEDSFLQITIANSHKLKYLAYLNLHANYSTNPAKYVSLNWIQSWLDPNLAPTLAMEKQNCPNI